MANWIRSFPTTSGGDPETLPWATDGVTLEPTVGQETNGWQPQAIAGPPDYRLENYARYQQSQINTRGRQTALFLEYARAEITLAGFDDGFNQRRITISGHNFDQTDAVDLNTTRDAFVAAINSDPVVSIWVFAESTTGGKLRITDKTPGNVYTVSPSLAVSVLAGAGTITVSSPATTPIVREDDAGMAADLVIGGLTADDDGNAAHDSRIIWRKSRGSFRAGTFTGTQADLANTGTASVAMGSNPTASGSDSVAIGNGATASQAGAIAIGTSASSASIGSVAIGDSATVGTTATESFAASAGSVANTCTNAVAMAGGAASNSYALAAGGSTASGYASVAIGSSATANSSGAVAIGRGTMQATSEGALAAGYAGSTASVTSGGNGSFAHGYAKDTNAVINASGKGALAHGYADSVSEIQATGNGSVSLGYQDSANITVASGANSFAHGNACDAGQSYSRATGYATKTTTAGEEAHAASPFTTVGGSIQQGSSQIGTVHLLKKTTDATDQILTPGTGTVSFNPAADTIYIIDCMVAAKKEGVDNDYAMWSFKVMAAWVAGAFTVKKVIGITNAAPAVFANFAAGANVTQMDSNGGCVACTVNVQANANKLELHVTGLVFDVRWTARLDYVAVGQVS